MNYKDKLFINTIIILWVICVSLIAYAGGNKSDLYRLLRVEGYTEEQIKYYISLPQVKTMGFENNKVIIKKSCLLVSNNFKQVFLFDINDSCHIEISKIIDLNKRKK